MKSKILGLLAVALLATTGAAHAATFSWQFALAPEVPGATGTGSAIASFNDATNIFAYNVTFSGLSGDTTAAHFHCCTASAGVGNAGVAVASPYLSGLPLGVKAGSFSGFYDLSLASSFGSGFLGVDTAADARARFLAGLNAGTAYLNIHSNTFPGGEIRGFARVPEPGTLALLGLGLAGLGLSRRRKAA